MTDKKEEQAVVAETRVELPNGLVRVGDDKIFIYGEVGDEIGYVQLVDHMGDDLRVVNAARVSFGAESEEFSPRDERLVKYLADHHHTSPFEHCMATFIVKVPIFIRSQHHRHRTWCLSGDTEITFNRPNKWRKGQHSAQSRRDGSKFTLRSLYDMWTRNSHTQNTVRNMLIRVYDEKEKKFTVSKVLDVIHSGKKTVYEITTEKGKKLKLTKEHQILTPEGWETLEDAVGLSVTSTGLASMSKENYIVSNGTTAWRSYEWMKNQRELGHSVQEIADNAGCSYHTIRKWLKNHDLQFDQMKAMFSHNKERGFGGKPLAGKYEKIVKIELIGEEEVYDLSVEGPNHNFIANGMVVHNCFNEISRRYTQENIEFFNPVAFRRQHKSNRQASVRAPERFWTSDGREDASEALRAHHEASVALYDRLLEIGVCREQARGVLPQNLYTQYYATIDLSNLAKFYYLRNAEGAQWEIAVVAQAMSHLVKDRFPNVWPALVAAIEEQNT